MIPGSANPLLLRSAAVTGYQIQRSLRFNSSDSAYLSRTPASAGNRKTWTWAGWVKRSKFGTQQNLFHAGVAGVSDDGLFFSSGDAIILDSYGVSSLTTSQVFRDASAWYHIVWTWDTDNATSSDRSRLYINGARVTAFSSASYPGSGATSPAINNTTLHTIGSHLPNFVSDYPDGYLADIHFIDGQALDPTSFGEFSATTGVWMPKQYTGSYGTNGFHLDFSNNASAAALGTDTSGNGNTWTVNNISVAAGAGNDSLVDVPTNGAQTDTGVGGEVRGNYCTLNPLANGGNTLSNGNLQAVGGSDKTTLSTIGITSGKWYCEATIDAVGTSSHVGIAKGDIALNNWLGNSPVGWSYSNNGQKYNNNSGSSYGNSYTTGNVIGIAFDADAGSLYFYKNGTVQNSGTAAFTGLTTGPYFFAFGANGPSITFNFGQRPFAYTAPSGFKALCTANLPAPLVTKPSTVMDVALYTGNNTARSITGLGFSPDFVWIKGRSGATDHALYDIVRGVQKDLVSNSTAAETTQSTGLTAFNSDGFSIGTLAKLNTNSATYAGWCWDAGSSTVTNTQGSITSTVSVRANTTAGFSVVTYTGTGTNCTVGHGLGVAPSLIIVKSRSAANDWAVYHAANTSDPKTDYLLLNSTAATADDNTYWNDTAPTSTVFSIGTNADVNTNGTTYVAYCWAPQVGYSSFGSYTGNGSTDGPFVYTGFRPRWVLTKRTDSNDLGYAYWAIFDAARSSANVTNQLLYANLSDAEITDTTNYSLDILSNGFKARDDGGGFNASGGTYIYAAFAEHPFQYARAR